MITRALNKKFLALTLIIAGFQVSYAEEGEKGFEAFKVNVHPILLKHCASCHMEDGPGPAHSVEDAKRSYQAVRSYISNFMDLKNSKFVKAGLRSDMAGDSITSDGLVSALQKWWDGGENMAFLDGKKTLSSQRIPALPMDGSFIAMKWDLSELDPKFKSVQFKVDIQRFAQATEKNLGSYRLRNPRIVSVGGDIENQMIEVQGVHLILNGIWNSMANNYATIKTLVPSEGQSGILSKVHQIVLEVNGDGADEIAFAFGKIDVSAVVEAPAPGTPIVTAPPKRTEATSKALGAAFDEFKVGKAARFVQITASPEKPAEFEMGSPPNVGGQYGKEDLHWVKLTRSFEIQSTEVTQLQWYLVMQGQGNDTPSRFKDKSQCDEGNYPQPHERLPDMCKHHPVEQVSWDDVQIFIRRLNALQSQCVYRLPTESEWEYVARAGLPPEYAYGFGNDFDAGYAWYSGNSKVGNRENSTHAVATKFPVPSPQDENAEIYDMAGNVWEWVQDWHDDYPQGSVVNPQGPPTGSTRVFRGGGWNDYASDLRAARRYNVGPGYRSYGLGFRLVRTCNP